MAAGYREIEVYFRENPNTELPVGTLAEKNSRLFFEYHSEWLAKGVELSPFTLPLQPGLISHQDHKFGPLFGLFDDSLPDGWGVLLMDRFFRSRKIDPGSVSILERLLCLGDKTMGALTYSPAIQREGGAGNFDLQELATEARLVFSGKSKDILPQLMQAGGSPGGAWPKVLVGFNPGTNEMISGEGDMPSGFEHWIVKFSAKKDIADAGPVEYAYARMAGAAGLEMEETRLFSVNDDERYFGVKRFDRLPGNRRCHVHTFGNLIHANFRVPGSDYTDLLKATTLLTRDNHDLESAYRAMAFNVFAHNRDDHVKNFSFLLDDQTGKWSFSPSYDLTFSRGPGGEHTMTVLGEGMRPTENVLMRSADQAGMPAPRARKIIEEIQEAVSCWSEFAVFAGVRAKTSKKIASFLML